MLVRPACRSAHVSSVTEAVDLEAEGVTCPACGHRGPLDDEGARADCGLVFGVPDEG